MSNKSNDSAEKPACESSPYFSEFIKRFPEYGNMKSIDDLRKTEYSRLDRLGQVYLDYTGGGLYSEKQVKDHSTLLLDHVFGNPHSTNPTSKAMTDLVVKARNRVLEFFNASPEEYVCIFTQNASGALKLVGESYPFSHGDTYLLTFDNHNSVNGIREFARSKGAAVHYTPVLPPEMRIDEEKLENFLDFKKTGGNNLFAFPAQSNFSGVKHSLTWIERAHEKGWDVLLDGAAFTPTNQLDLSKVHPDFVTLSFYKIFGYPTGVGALIARQSAMSRLHRPWFAGGTITVASVQGDTYYLHKGAEGFEDGTLNYLSLPAVTIGLDHIASIGYGAIQTRVNCLTGWLLEKLNGLSHSNGNPVVKIYGPLEMRDRGGTIACNFFDQRGHFIDHLKVESRANTRNISIRTGCFCNPGGGELALGISADELTSCFALRPNMEYDDFRQCIDDKSNGAVRISVGLVTNFDDVSRFYNFAREFVDKDSDQI